MRVCAKTAIVGIIFVLTITFASADRFNLSDENQSAPSTSQVMESSKKFPIRCRDIGKNRLWIYEGKEINSCIGKTSSVSMKDLFFHLHVQTILLIGLTLGFLLVFKHENWIRVPVLLLISFFCVVAGTNVGYQGYATSGEDGGFSIVRTSNGFYLATGYSTSGGSGLHDVVLIRISSTFSLISTQYFGGTNEEYGEGIDTTNDGGSIVVGNTLSFSHGANDAYVLRFDSNDNFLWSKNFGGTSDEYAYSVKCLSNGNCIIVGYYTTSYNEGWIFSLDSEGNQVFSHIIETPAQSQFRSFDILSDGSFVIAGTYYQISWIPCITKLDSSCGTEWQQKYTGSSGRDHLLSMTAGPNSAYLACGYLETPRLFYILMINFDNSELWVKKYGEEGVSNWCWEVANLQNGDYAAIGHTASVGRGSDDGWVMKLSFEGNLLFQSPFGGTSSDVFRGFVIESDGGYTVFGNTKSFPSLSSSQNFYVKGGYFICEPGYYDISSVCTFCPAGTYTDKSGATECSKCPAGSYQPEIGQTSCILCPAGQYQSISSQISCINCEIGTYSSISGSSSCTGCSEGFYQDTPGMTSCQTCATNYYPNFLKTLCLYKGIFSDEASFTSSSFKVNCFDSGGIIITPFTEACRNSYRALCCLGSSTLSAGPICNIGLEISSTSSLWNKYCSACPFMDQTKCPEQGLCWDDSLYMDNNYDPYSSFSPGCIEAVKSYCGEKLQSNSNDGECYVFKSKCASATISSASYGTSYSSFTIVAGQKLSTEAIGTDIFNSGMSKAKVAKKSETELSIDISEMASPPSSFQFKYRGVTNFCEVGFSESIVHSIAMPTKQFETLSISSSTTDVSKCANFIVSSTLTKPYSWTVENTWNFQYTTTSTPTDTINFVSTIKTSTISLEPDYLLEGETFEISLSIINPFSRTITSNILSYTVQTLPIKNYPCSPCQFHDRTKCINFNSICWDSYTTYHLSYPLLFTENCLAGIALVCYPIWKANGIDDSQCKEFVSYIDYSKMSIKPNVNSYGYLIDGILKLRIVFDTEVKTTILPTCNSIFDEETLISLGRNPQCIWTSSQILDVIYSGTSSLVISLKLREKAIYFNYKYAANPADSVTLTPNLPDLSDTISINAASYVSHCKTLLLSAVTKVNGIFTYTYNWELSYPLITISSTIQSNFESLASQNSKILAVSSDNLISENNLQVILKTHVSLLNVNIITSKTISISPKVPEVSFASSELYELNLVGNQTNDLGLIINNDPCNGGTNEESTITFTVYSGTTLTAINTRSTQEKKIEQTLSSNYQLYKTLQANIKSGFQYNNYYHLTVCASFTGFEAKSCKTKILGIYKPKISVTISELSSLMSISDSILLNGAKSVIPLEVNERVKFQWQCISCYSFVSNSECDCPYISESEARSRVLTLLPSKLSGSCKYKFRLTVTSQSGAFLRADSADALFITYSGSLSCVEGIIINGNQNDLYFTFTLSYKGKDSDLSFQWSLIEASSTLSTNKFSYSMYNTFIYDFFAKKSITLNSQSKSGDQEIPSSIKPRVITSDTTRILGIDKSSLISECYYKYAVLIQEPTTVSAAIVSIQAPKLPASRSFEVTPISGRALETKFIFTFPVSAGISDPDEIIKILILKCDGSEKFIYHSVGSSTSFEGVLNSGESECEYQVTIILRVSLEEEYIDNKLTITVLSSLDSSATAIATLLSQVKQNIPYTSSLAILSSITLTAATEESEQTKTNIEGVYDYLSQLDDSNSGVFSKLDGTEKLQFLNSSLLILGNLLEQNTINNLNLTLQDLVEQKINNYISSFESNSNSVYLIPSAINTLSSSASLKKKREGEQSYSNLPKTLEKMRQIKMKTLQPDGPSYEVNSSTISLKILKQYEDDFNLAQEISNSVTINLDSSTQTAKTKVELPSGLTTKIIQNMPYVASLNTTFVVCSSMISLKVNPYENVKTNALVDVSSISSLSYNTQWIDASVIKSIYRDLRRHAFRSFINLYSQETDLILLSFNGSSLEKDGTTTEYSEQIKIGQLDSTVAYHHPYLSTEENRENNIIIPYYKEKGYWTNKNCFLTDVSDNEISSKSTNLGTTKDSSSGNTADIITDILSDTLSVLKSGNYKALISFGNFNSLSVKNIIILSCCGILLVGVILSSIVLHLKDKRAITRQRIKTLKYLVLNQELPPPDGIIAKLFHFINLIKKKGLKALSQDTEDKVIPEGVPNADGQVENIDPTNGYSVFNEEEKQLLESLHTLYEEKCAQFTEEEVEEILATELANCDPLTRRTKDYIEDTMLGYIGLSLLLFQHQFLSAFLMIDLRVTRPIKLLVLGVVIFGELAVNGLFFGSEDSMDLSSNTAEFVSITLIYSFVTAIVLLPVKIVVGHMLCGLELKEEMTREEIVSKEKCSAILEKVGFIFGWCLFTAEIYAIVMFSVNFNDNAVNSWLLTYGTTLVDDNIVLYLAKIGTEFFYAGVLQKIIDTKCLQDCGGQIIGCILEFIMNIIS